MPRLAVGCENCRYVKIHYRTGDQYQPMTWDGRVGEPDVRSCNSAQCRIAPPVVAPHPEEGGGWPYVALDDWCGQFVGHDGHGFDNPDQPQLENF